MNSKIMPLVLLVANCFLSAFSQLLLKKGALQKYDSVLWQYLNPLVLGGYGMFFVVLCVNVFLLKFLPISVSSAISESSPVVLSFISGRIFFKEEILKKNVLGAILVVIGILIIIL